MTLVIVAPTSPALEMNWPLEKPSTVGVSPPRMVSRLPAWESTSNRPSFSPSSLPEIMTMSCSAKVAAPWVVTVASETPSTAGVNTPAPTVSSAVAVGR